jgi:hypothetical protein
MTGGSQQSNALPGRISNRAHHHFPCSVTCRCERNNNGGEFTKTSSTRHECSSEAVETTSPEMNKPDSRVLHTTTGDHPEPEGANGHLSINTHGVSHFAEHLAAASGRDIVESEAKVTSLQNSNVQDRPVSRVAKHLNPITPAHVVTEVSSHDHHNSAEF